MNKVVLIGRLTRDPELRYTGNNTPVASFSLAVNRNYSNQQGEREADFINIVAWDKTGENVGKYMTKGRLIAVEGRIQTGSFDGQDGQRRYTTEVVADQVNFLETRSQSQSRQNSSFNNYQQPAPSMDFSEPAPMNNVDLQDDPFADFGDSVSIDDNFLD